MIMKMENNTTNNDIISAIIPVKFFDGEIELDKGTVQIIPSLTFKAFQSIISKMLQISPHQITIYFQSQNSNYNYNYNHNHHRRRHPVTSKFDFKSICTPHESNSSNLFWVVQKRSRRTRRRKNNNNRVQFSFNGGNGMINFNNHPAENFSILRRGEFINEFEYFNRINLLEKEKEREKYLMSLSLNSNVYNDLSFGAFYNGGGGYYCSFSDDGASSSGGGSSSATSAIGFCDVCFSCRSSGDNTVPFHCCKNDAVTKVFRSPAGPIAPPKKMIDFLV